MNAITLRQVQVLDYLDRYSREFYCSPTFREVAQAFGWRSPQGSLRHLEALTRKGYLLRIIAGNGCHRGYRLSVSGEQALMLAVGHIEQVALRPGGSATSHRARTQRPTASRACSSLAESFLAS